MNSRERVMRSLNKEVPDRIPMDLGTTNCTTLTKKAYENLKKFLGIEKETRFMMENFQVVFVDEEVLQILNIDTRGIHPQPIFQKEIINNNSYRNEFGITFRMPQEGLYYDMVQHPLAGKSLEELKEYPWPNPENSMNLKGLQENAKNCTIKENFV